VKKITAAVMGEKSVMAFAPALVPVTFRPLAASPPFAGRCTPFGRETHFRAVLGGEDAVEYLLCGHGPGG
jgi:hypothetical protein